jgi:hypothetical protein
LSSAGLLRLDKYNNDKRAFEIAKAQELVARARSERPIAPGHARIVYFTLKTCGICSEFKAQVLAPILAEFKDIAEADERAAWDGLPAPLVFVGGAEDAMFEEAPELGVLREAVLKAARR